MDGLKDAPAESQLEDGEMVGCVERRMFRWKDGWMDSWTLGWIGENG